jgi:ribonuclease-3
LSLFRGIKYFLLAEKSKKNTLKEILGFKPKNLTLYEQAFVHKSILNESDQSVQRESNERLEFLGDAILGAVVAQYLFLKYPKCNEGELTKFRSKIVNRKFLNELAVDIGLDVFIETSANIKRSKSIFGDAFEAFIGAIFLDKGYQACRNFITDVVIKEYIDVDVLILEESDYKSKLIEWVQKNKSSYTFNTVEIIIDGIKNYKTVLLINKVAKAEGRGSSKKSAEQEAAKIFFKEISQ